MNFLTFESPQLKAGELGEAADNSIVLHVKIHCVDGYLKADDQKKKSKLTFERSTPSPPAEAVT